MRRSLTLFLFTCWILRSFAQELPIKPARTVSFTTDEGTHMNVDVSPDGKTLVFDLLGDLYTVPATGGDAKQVTRGLALNNYPLWSPGGRVILYYSDLSERDPYDLIHPDGSSQRVLPRSGDLNSGGRLFWTPDGHYIGNGKILYGLAGNTLNLPPDFPRDALLVTADGKFAYYSDSGKIAKYDILKKTSTQFSGFIDKKIKSGTLSPDGSWVAYSPRDSVLLIQNVRSGARQLIDLSEQLGHYAFAPDSKSLFIAYNGKIHQLNLETGENKIIPFVAHVKSDLGPLVYRTIPLTHDPVPVRYTRSANASPDGKHLVFSALNKLYVKDLPAGKPRLLTAQSLNQFQPVYSPDSKWIAYVSWCDTVGGYLWRVPAAGGKPEQLTSIPGQYQRPAWSPDGKLIAVIRGKPRLGQGYIEGLGLLELVAANGGPVQPIADSIPLRNQLSFSPDGQRILYEPDYKFSNQKIPQIVSRNLEGKDLQAIAFGEGDGEVQQRALSPDGRFIVYEKAEDLYLVPMCRLADTPVINGAGHTLSVIRFSKGLDPHWENGGKVLSWSYSNKFYRVDPDKVLALAERTDPATGVPLVDDPYEVTAVPATPDQVISLELTPPAYRYGHGTVAFKNVRIITMQGNKVIEQGTIVIKDGRFVAVGPATKVPIPPHARIFDLAGKTVMPGLIDIHLHIRLQQDIFPQQFWAYLVNLAYGVTTARDPSSSYDSFGAGELLESGQMLGPRLFTVGRAIGPSHGVTTINTFADALAEVNKRKEMGGTWIKQYMLDTRLQRQWLLEACQKAGLNMTNEGARDLFLETQEMKDGSTGVEHNPVWGKAYQDVISFYAATGTYFTPTLQVEPEGAEPYFFYKFWHFPDEKLARFTLSNPSRPGIGVNLMSSIEAIKSAQAKDTLNVAFAYAAKIDAQIRNHGGRVTLGSHGEGQGIGAHNELWALQMGSLTNMQALQAATIMGAQALGIQKDVGSIEAGKIADLIILNKNPLDDIHNSREIKYVMKDGVLYDGDTLDEIWPGKQKCPDWRLHEKTDSK